MDTVSDESAIAADAPGNLDARGKPGCVSGPHPHWLKVQLSPEDSGYTNVLFLPLG